MDRRQFITTLAAAGTSCVVARNLRGGEPEKPGPYKRANTDWLAKCRYGVGVHWTAQTAPRHGSPLPFQKAVDAFDVPKFVDQLTYAGADYLLFTAAHALQMLPAPNPVIDKILPGRTCKRDLIAELADALAAKGMPLSGLLQSFLQPRPGPALGTGGRLPRQGQAAIRPEPHRHHRLDGRAVQGQDQGLVVRQPIFPRSSRAAQ